MNVLRKRGAIPLAAVGLAVAVVLAGCSTPTDTETETPADDTGLQYAQEQLDKYSGIVEGFLPTEPLGDSASLAGKSIVYIPAVAQIPFFATSYSALQKAFEVVGVTVQICDAKATPGQAAGCLDQALTTGAAGVILDALPPVIAQESFDAVVAAGVPVVLGNIPIPEGSPATVQRAGPDTALATALAADAIIVRSGGSANVVTVTVTDSPVTQAWMENGANAEFAEYCPDCTVSNVDTKTAEIPELPAKVSAAVLANPDVDFLLPSLSPVVVPTIQGGTDAGKTLPAASTATTSGDLQALSEEGLFTSVGWDIVRTQWITADLMMRLILGHEVDGSEYVVPVRVFTPENITDFDISQEGWDSSNWFGGSDYQDTLAALWTE